MRAQRAIGVDKDIEPIPCLPYDGMNERVSQAEEIFRDIFEFESIVIVRDQNKEEILKAGNEAARGACLLAAPTGTASFQIKAGATTLHRLFGIPIGVFCANRSTETLARRTRILRDCSLIAMDEFSMIGRIMMGKVKFRVDEALGADNPDVGVIKSLGGKDCMLSGDPDQTQPIGDDSLHREGRCFEERRCQRNP